MEEREKFKLGVLLKTGEYLDVRGKNKEWKVGQVVWV